MYLRHRVGLIVIGDVILGRPVRGGVSRMAPSIMGRICVRSVGTATLWAAVTHVT